MITKTRLSRLSRSWLALAALLAFSSLASADTQPPAAVTDLVASSGPVPGTISLSWTAPNDPPSNVAAYSYFIRFAGASIITEATWTTANSIQDLGATPPIPKNPGGAEALLLTGLQQGVTYYFNIKSRDTAGNISNMQVTSPFAVATAGSGGNADDGSGTGLVNSSIQRAKLETVRATYTATANLGVGAQIALQVPDLWGTLQTSNPGYSGYVTYAPGGGVTATFSSSLSGQRITLTILSGSLNATQIIIFNYLAFTCDNGAGTFHFYSKATATSQLKEITSSPTAATTAGPPNSIGFENWSMAVQKNTVTPIKLFARDMCGGVTTVGADKAVTLSAERWNGSTYVPDTIAAISTNPTMSPSGQLINSQIDNGTSNRTFYYNITGTTFAPNNYLRLEFVRFPPDSGIIVNYANIRPLNGGISNSSVDLGTVVPGQKTVTFTPNGDGVGDLVYFSADLPASIGWRIELATASGLPPTRTIWGYSDKIRVNWDGFTDWTPFGPPTVAAPGTYTAKFILDGGVLIDTSCAVTLSANGVVGRVVAQAGGAPIGDADVSIYGPGGFRSTRSIGSGPDKGKFSLYGLRASVNNTLRIQKPGSADKVVNSITVPNGVQDLGDIAVSSAAYLKLTFTRSGTELPDVYGNVNARTQDGSKYAFGTLRFGFGQTVADAGNTWEVNPTSFTLLALTPGVTHVVHIEAQGWTAPDFSVDIAAGQTLAQTIALVRNPKIEGTVSVSSNTSGLWISVQAERTNAGQFDADRFFHGGVWLNPSETTGTYKVYGVPNGTYRLSAVALGYARQTLNVTVAGADITNANFPVFSPGGVLVGTVTVIGDTTGLPESMSGHFRLYINCWSPENFTGSWRELDIPKHVSLSTKAYSLPGLSDGIYQFYSYLSNGFDLEPAYPAGSVSGGAGTLNVTFRQRTGSLTGQITLPGGNVDYANVKLELLAFDGGPTDLLVPTITGGGVYTFSGLGTRRYKLQAHYRTTGAKVVMGVDVRNGTTKTVNIDLSAPTYSASGRISTTARSPFNSLTYLVNSTTGSWVMWGQGSILVPANTVFAVKVERENFQGPPTGAGMPFFSPVKTSTGTYDTNGDYVIPYLSKGVWEIFPFNELNGNTSDGPEITKTRKIIYVSSVNVTGVDFTLTDGFNVSGMLRRAGGLSESTGRSIRLQLLNANREAVAEKWLFMTGDSVSFSLERVPAGDYQLMAEDMNFPKKYTAEDRPISVSGTDLSNIFVDLIEAGRIQGKLRLEKTGEILSPSNYMAHLPSDFRLEARADPWRPGGYYSNDSPLVGPAGYSITVKPGTYKVLTQTNDYIGASAQAQGKKQFIPVSKTGIEVASGQTTTVDIDLTEGKPLGGTVTDTSGTPLPNIPIEAYASHENGHERLRAFTDENGKYNLQGIDPDQQYYDVIAAPRFDSHDPQSAFGFETSGYGEVHKRLIDVQAVSAVNFTLEAANSSVQGTVANADGTPLQFPFEENLRGAAVFLHREGAPLVDNPIGEVESFTDPDGNYLIKGLTKGRYTITVLEQGHASGKLENVIVGDGVTTVSPITLASGARLEGDITRSDGSNVTTADLDTLVATTLGFKNVLVGKLEIDTAKNITGYEISGFLTGKTYKIVGFTRETDDIVSLGEVKFDGTSSVLSQTLVFEPSKPEIFTRSRKQANGDVDVRFELTRALRNSQVLDVDADSILDDNEPSNFISLLTGNGSLSFPANAISDNRKILRATYRPATGETSFVLRFTGTFVTIDPETGINQTETEDFTYYAGIGQQISAPMPNATGADLQFEEGEDTSGFTGQPGTWGDDAAAAPLVVVNAAATTNGFVSAAGGARLTGALAVAETLGLQAYPSEMGMAIKKARTLDVSPVGSFYQILLPAGVSHFFPKNSPAQLCVKYDPNLTSADIANVYYFNSAKNQYTIEKQDRLVDTTNHRVCVNINHASVFTVFSSSDSVLTGGSYTGPLHVINFPNPFNLKSKTVTLQNPGSLSASQSINGTMIKYSVPSTMGGAVEIEIYNVAGEKVRTIETTVTGGSHYYTEWDGTNEKGEKVASGVYIARFTIGGANEKFFKMAVIK